MATLLFLAANPIDSENVRIDEECREIEARLSSVPGNRIRIQSKWAVRPQDLQRALLEFSPTLVHLTGHGDESGQIVLENVTGYSEPVTADALADLFRTFSSSVRCVVLNACDSAEQARQLVRFVDCAVGMQGDVSAGAGMAFVTSFYQALAYGKDVSTAFDLGCNQIQLEGRDEESTPQLYLREGIEQVYPAQTTSQTPQVAPSIEELLSAQVSLARTALGPAEDVILGPIAYDEEPPPIVEKCSARTATVSRVQNELAGRSWYAMYGGIGSGKTHLGVLLARQHAGRCVWLRLRDRTPAQALSVIDGTLARITQRQARRTRAAWYEECCATVGHDAVFVLDDLPRTSGREELDDALTLLARAARKAGITLITISPVPLPSPTRAAVGREVLEESTPAFSDAEVLELLAAHGAPAAFLTEAWAVTVSAICRQHPLLLTEAALFLEARGWVVSAQTFQEVLSGAFAINLDAPTQADLVRTIPDPDTRQLLYRLRIAGGPFSGSDVRELASLPKPVDHPAERLMSLLGLWIQRDGQDRYLISPLVSRLSGLNLSRQTEKASHEYLASRLVRGRRMTALTALQAIHHYVAADCYVDAGMLLLTSLLSYLKAKEPKDDFMLSDLWTTTRLPTGMPLALRVGIRSIQISIYVEKRKDPTFLLADLEQLLASEELPPELQGYDVLLGGIAGVALWSTRPADAIRYGVRSLRSLRAAPAEVLGMRPAELQADYYDLLWSSLSQVKPDAQLRDCLDHLAELQAGELSRWAESKLADGAAAVVCNTIWLAEHGKSEADRDWDRALRALEMVGDWARDRGVTVLYAWAQRGRVIVLAEYLKRFDEAIALGEHAIAASASSAEAAFCLADIVGRQYHYVSRWSEALAWLTRCVKSDAEVSPAQRVYVTALAGISAAHLGDDSAVVHLTQAADLALAHANEVATVLAATIQAELGFERWRRGERVLAFGSLSKAAELLLDSTKADDSWKITITVFGNFAGFYAYVALGNAEESWPHAKPAPGSIFDRNPPVLDLFDPAKLYAIAAQLTLLAESLGLHKEALSWSGRASLAGYDLGMHSTMVPFRVAAHVVEGRFADALAESWSAYTAGTNSPGADQRAIRLSQRVGKVTATIICLSLATVRVTQGRDAADQVRSLLEEQLPAASGLDPFWTAVVDAMRQIANGEGNWRVLYKAANEWEERGETQLGLLYRLAAMMVAAPQDAFHLTMCTFPKPLLFWLGDTPYQMVAVPFLRAYWPWALERSSFHFSVPGSTARALGDALALPGEAGLKRALQIVAGSLGTRLSARYREYLFS